MSKSTRDYQQIIKQLEDLQGHCSSMAAPKDAEEIWKSDVDALQEAIDIIADYEKATAQAAAMVQKYEQPEMAIKRAAGIYTCPLCGKRTQVGHTHCHWCGKKLSWDREAYSKRDYPHLGTGGRRNGRNT